MRIWIIDHYSVPVKYYPLARNTIFAKHLMKMGHEVIIFAASTVHNSNLNLIENSEKYKEITDDDVKYVLVKCHQYTGNGIKRILNMYEFAHKLSSVCKRYPKPDAIVSTSMTLQACKKGIQLGEKYGCKKIAQITDLWPESLIAYGKATEKHPIVLLFRRIEKWIYTHADSIVFTMEGAYDYILSQRWEKEIPQKKVFFVNNGVDLELFEYNKNRYSTKDVDLKNPDTFKVVYTGSIRKANEINLLVDAAKEIKNEKIIILVWGAGDELEELKRRKEKEKVHNIVFKGPVNKNEVPAIICKGDVLFLDPFDDNIARYGISSNKLFEYFAAGKPILTNSKSPYNPAEKNHCNIFYEKTAKGIAKAIISVYECDSIVYKEYCQRAFNAAREYSFDRLTKKMVNIINRKNTNEG